MNCSALALTVAMVHAGPAQANEVPGVGHEGQGADLVVLQLDGNARPDMIVVAYDNPPGANSFRYKVGLNLNAQGVAAGWSNHIQVPGLGHLGQGTGAAVADLDGNGRPELILMAYDNPPGANAFRYTIGWNLNAQGVATNWSSHAQVGGVGHEGQGAAVVIGQLDANPRPDMIFIAYDNPPGPNTLRYRVGMNVNAQGNATWAANHVQVDGVGHEGEGLGAALANVDANGRPDLVLLAYDAPPAANNFRARTGLNLNAAGAAASWQPGFQGFAGVGHLGQGAGLAIACLDGDPRADWITLAYDNPPGANSFRYNVHPNRSQAPCPTLVGGGGGTPPQPSLPQRKSITQLTPTEVASLRRGFAQMRAWNTAPKGSANYRRSLQYWANMHAHMGTGCADASNLTRPGMSGLTRQDQSNADEQATWCKCQHGNDSFPTWHRMYLYYFEQVLQAAAGDANLRLPFFDYETNAQIPLVYREGTQTANSLRVDNRQSALNAGTASIDPAFTSTTAAMAQTAYTRFREEMEGTPHGAVHCALGVQSCPSGYMGFVPSAGNDPIFYSHHANIDRLYECWLKVSPGSRLPTDPAVLNATFTFVDGSGALVTRRAGDMLTTKGLGYSYPAGGGCPASAASAQDNEGVQTVRAAPRAVGEFPATGAVRLERGVTRVPVAVHPDVRERLTAEGPGNPRSLLVIDGLTFDQAPQVSYKVFIEGTNGRRALAGTIHFFGLAAHDHGGGGTVTIDATEALLELGEGTAGSPKLVFEPATGVAEEGLESAVRQTNPAANVRFNSARIRVV
jgi:hypothetical protein